MPDIKYKELERAYLAGWNEMHKCNSTISLATRKIKFKIWYDKKYKIK